MDTLKRPVRKSRNILLSEECEKLLNFRIEQEEFSSRLYLAMSMCLNNEGYTGAASLWKKYSDEEMKHADWARTYLLSMGVTPETPALKKPKSEYPGCLAEIIKDSFDHEIVVTKQIKEMADVAFKKGDHMLYELCLSYLKEQVEEHDKTQTWLDKLMTFGSEPALMRLLDEEMAEA
jgi:ferritin